MVIVGVPPANAVVSLPPIYQLVVGEKRIIGSHFGSTRLSVDVLWLVDLYLQGRLKLDEFITARYPLEQINEALASTVKGEALRNVIVF